MQAFSILLYVLCRVVIIIWWIHWSRDSFDDSSNITDAVFFCRSKAMHFLCFANMHKLLWCHGRGKLQIDNKPLIFIFYYFSDKNALNTGFWSTCKYLVLMWNGGSLVVVVAQFRTNTPLEGYHYSFCSSSLDIYCDGALCSRGGNSFFRSSGQNKSRKMLSKNKKKILLFFKEDLPAAC